MALADTYPPDDAERGGLARHFVRVGRIGFWLQLILLIVVLFLAVSVVRFGGSGQAARYLSLGNVVSFLALALPVFTTVWFRHYVGLGRQMEVSATPPSLRKLERRAWIGVSAGAIGAVLSLLMLFGAISNLLYVLITAPQVGLMISPATSGDGGLSVSAIDAVSLLSLLITLTTELVVIALSLWLVFVTRFGPAADQTEAAL